MIGSLMDSRNSLKPNRDESDIANIPCVPIHLSGANAIKINENVFDLPPEI